MFLVAEELVNLPSARLMALTLIVARREAVCEHIMFLRPFFRPKQTRQLWRGV
jgi:hypothetical protein